MSIKYQDMLIDESLLQPIRKALYHSESPGYYIFPKFISPEFTNHIIEFWSNIIVPKHSHKPFRGKQNFHERCPNFISYSGPHKEDKAFYNFLWNSPPDEVTYTISFQIQVLRNLVETRPLFREIFPLQGRSMSYRVVITKNGGNIVPPHKDWINQNFDPRRLQATLFLSKKGIDYTGKGCIFETNQGNDVVFGDDVLINPGDLVLWRYINQHSVQDISTEQDKLGFMRIIFPPEFMNTQLSMLRPYEIGTYLKSRLCTNAFILKNILPIYRKVRGL